ncbi:MBL fold metallo-hydrolase [Pseudonocardia endophytica]|uniref:Glyoxylase-like metal-dependent hydrolase (Beta-lactamase superfamily II) n=1 Tax=Pseudonocardia endophytica TaxID=401976 RepID=A0A4R1HXB1_PSEEN|nr:MBL fold metallo-hydrolase [Pseudonocardia endophytica]TCK22182.1 glyoxylase-like metal-dependent hydrolase (beta-lactamase superfamily II) [Pseudonocardia endophytica]
MRIGSVEVLPVLDGVARLPLEMAVRNTRGSAWDCPHQSLDDDGRLLMGIGAFLVRARDRTVLVDLGAGNGFIHEAFTTGDLPANLIGAGVEPDDVTDVVLTHMHVDHVGWATTQGRLTFPRATYRVHAADWDYFMEGAGAEESMSEFLAPVETRLETFDEEVELLPGLRARPAPGHTPGSTVFVVNDAGERALLLGDVVHTVNELTDPEWEGMFDVDREAANAVRAAIADDLTDSGDLFAPAHLPGLAFGRLVTADGLRTFRAATESA